MNEPLHALIVGASGATGKPLLEQLLANEAIGQVTVFVRKAMAVSHPKLVQQVIDFEDTASWQAQVKGDVLFSCLGTTLKDAGSQAAQRKIDYDYQYAFALAAKRNQMPAYVLVSSAHADSQSRLFYPRIKGELEQAVSALGFERCVIARPPLLLRPDSNRTGEKIGARLLGAANRLGCFKQHRPLPTAQLAQALMLAALQTGQGIHILESQDIWRLIQA